MRGVIITRLILSTFLFFIISLASNLLAQEYVPFVKIYPEAGDDPIIRGDMKVIGNSILGLDGEDHSGSDYEPNEDYNGTSENNRLYRSYIDIDSDSSFDAIFDGGLSDTERDYSGSTNTYGSPSSPSSTDTGTFSSSAAELIINNPASPAGQTCSTVVKAYLYWGGLYYAESLAETTSSEYYQYYLDRPACSGCEYYTDIKILPPGATEYIDIKYDNTGTDYTSLKSEVIVDGKTGGAYGYSSTTIPAYNSSENEFIKDSPYACVADVTSLFEHLQDTGQDVEGYWTVANVRAATGIKRTGSGGGWSLAVVYEDPLATSQKSITFFEGFTFIEGSNPNGVEFNITGFQTIPSGPVNVDIATIALEGDYPFAADQFQINDQDDATGAATGTWVPLSYPSGWYTLFTTSISGAITSIAKALKKLPKVSPTVNNLKSAEVSSFPI